ncbi:MAG: hypothetical protein EHM23_00410 [Acidobacteria bacterium]|nr:MAG: hypothetical protein EHM23_00410 [Acidobacteriota bacterium]
MTTLEERLRNVMHETEILQMCEEAADEIERQRREIERLEAKARQLASTLATRMLDTSKDKEIEQLRETLRKCATEMAWQHAEIKRLREELVGADQLIKAAHGNCDRYRAEIKLMQAELEEYRK